MNYQYFTQEQENNFVRYLEDSRAIQLGLEHDWDSEADFNDMDYKSDEELCIDSYNKDDLAAYIALKCGFEYNPKGTVIAWLTSYYNTI